MRGSFRIQAEREGNSKAGVKAEEDKVEGGRSVQDRFRKATKDIQRFQNQLIS